MASLSTLNSQLVGQQLSTPDLVANILRNVMCAIVMEKPVRKSDYSVLGVRVILHQVQNLLATLPEPMKRS